MIRSFTARHALALCAAFLAVPLAAEEPVPAGPPLSLEQQMLLRCSAAFAIVAGEQQRGVAAAQAYPPLASRGKEFFVRAGARLMDELHLTREQVQARLQGEAAQLQQSGAGRERLVEVMGPCLQALEVSRL